MIFLALLENPLTNSVISLGCDEVMRLLEECHEKGFWWKVFGNCNEAKRNVNRCLAEVRTQQTAKNRAVARQERERVKERWREIDENS